MRTASLLGRDYCDVGALDLVAEGPAAIALSRGGAPKQYSYVDPNEDAAGFALGDAGALAVVADAHNGARASEVAVAYVLSEIAPAWITGNAPARGEAEWKDLAWAAVQRVNRAVLEACSDPAGGTVSASKTTLSFALIRQDQQCVVSAIAGDSHVFGVVAGASGAERAFELANARHGLSGFLGQPEEIGARERCSLGFQSANDLTAVVLATDGISEEGIGFEDPLLPTGTAIAAGTGERRARRGAVACRSLAEAAMQVQREQNAGDNIGLAVLWLEDLRR